MDCKDLLLMSTNKSNTKHFLILSAFSTNLSVSCYTFFSCSLQSFVPCMPLGEISVCTERGRVCGEFWSLMLDLWLINNKADQIRYTLEWFISIYMPTAYITSGLWWPCLRSGPNWWCAHPCVLGLAADGLLLIVMHTWDTETYATYTHTHMHTHKQNPVASTVHALLIFLRSKYQKIAFMYNFFCSSCQLFNCS